MRPIDVYQDLTAEERASLGACELRALQAEAEAMRIEAVRAAGAVPETCGPAIPVAPARGPVRVFTATALYPKGTEEFEMKPAGFRGRQTMAVADAFDVMAARARSNGKGDPFTPGQVAMGRHYAALVESHSAGGVKCSSIEGTGGGTGNGGDFMDAYLREGQELAAIRRKIGTGAAMVVRRQRPSKRGSRRTITDRALVDLVCVGGKTLAEVLDAHGWAKKGEAVAALRIALADALDRMQGPKRSRGVEVIRTDGPSWP